MSYMSRVALDDSKRSTLRALTQPHFFHAAVEAAINANERKLWRIDYFGGKYWLLLISQTKPTLLQLYEQFGCEVTETPYQTRDYTTVLNRIEVGQRWQYRLTANPVRSAKTDTQKLKERGKIYAHVTVAQQKDWLMQKADGNGFAIDLNEFDVVHSAWYRFKKSDGKNVTIRAVTFEGILTVTDKEQFKLMLVNGIGRAKAYGCGMLTIMKPSQI